MSRVEHEVYELFDRALDLPPDQRTDLLERACAGRPELRSEVESLLEADANAQGMLEPPALDLERQGIESSDSGGPNLFEGRRIGRYTLGPRLGIGGMSIVYEAQQDKPRRKVAIKLLRIGMAGASMQRRFEREAEILGRLRHPNIAQIFEGGSYESELGTVPYFAMELVEGALPITSYAERGGQTQEQRVRLFVEVCDAVAHAHQAGVLHRDLKPSNILVGADNRPKLIDFGIASALEPRGPDTTLHTRAGALIGTLSYMSPEQLAERELDVRTDVYGLGVVLYELLCGRLPYRIHASADALAHEIRYGLPSPPSAHQPEVDPQLDAIVLRALEKPLRRRYASAQALREDLERYLQGRQVTARQRRGRTALRRAIRTRRVLYVAGPALALGVGMLWLKASQPERLEPSEGAVAHPEPSAPEAPKGEERDYTLHVVQAAQAVAQGNLGQAKVALEACEPTLRRYEWHRLRAQVDRSAYTLGHHEGAVRALAYAPRSRTLVSGDAKGELRSWRSLPPSNGATQTPRFEPYRSWALPAPIKALAIHDASDRIFVALDEGPLWVWPLEGEGSQHKLPRISNVSSLAIDPSQRFLAAAPRRGTIVVYHLDTRSEAIRIEPPDGTTDLGFGPQGEFLYAASPQHRVHRWRVRTGEHIRSYEGARDELEAVLVSREGTQVLAGGWDNRLRAYDVASGELLRTFSPVADGIMDVYSLGEAKLAVATRSDELIIWERDTGRRVRTFRGHEQGVEAIAGDPAQGWLASASLDTSVRVWDLEAAPLDRQLPKRAHKIHALVWLRHSDSIVLATGPHWGRRPGPEVSRWSSEGEQLAIAEDQTRTVDVLEVNSDETRIVSGARDGRVVMRDAQTLQALWERQDHTSEITAIAFEAKGRVLVTSDRQGELKVWDSERGTPVAQRSLGVGVQDLIWHAGSLMVATGASLRRVRLSERGLSEGEELYVASGVLTRLASAGPDIILGDDTGTVVRIHPLAKGAHAEVKWRTETFGQAVSDLSLSRGGDRIAMASHDYGVRVLDANTGENLLLVGQHSSKATQARFSPDDRYIASAGFDRKVRLWGARAQAITGKSSRPNSTPK